MLRQTMGAGPLRPEQCWPCTLNQRWLHWGSNTASAPVIATPCTYLYLMPGCTVAGGGRGEPGRSRQAERLRLCLWGLPGHRSRGQPLASLPGPRSRSDVARGCSWMLVDARRCLQSLGRRHSAPHAHLPSLPGASSSAQAFAVYCLIIDIILQMAFGPANGITGVILLLVNYNQFVWDAFPVFVCNCSPHSLMTVTQQKLCSFAQG